MKNSSSESIVEAENNPVPNLSWFYSSSSSTNQKHYPVPSSDASSVCNYCTHSSDVICKHAQLLEFPCDIATVKTSVARMMSKYGTINPEGVVYRLLVVYAI